MPARPPGARPDDRRPAASSTLRRGHSSITLTDPASAVTALSQLPSRIRQADRNSIAAIPPTRNRVVRLSHLPVRNARRHHLRDGDDQVLHLRAAVPVPRWEGLAGGVGSTWHQTACPRELLLRRGRCRPAEDRGGAAHRGRTVAARGPDITDVMDAGYHVTRLAWVFVVWSASCRTPWRHGNARPRQSCIRRGCAVPGSSATLGPYFCHGIGGSPSLAMILHSFGLSDGRRHRHPAHVSGALSEVNGLVQQGDPLRA